MSHKNRSYVFIVFLTILGVIFNSSNVMVSAAPLNHPMADPRSTPIPTKSPATTPTSSIQAGAKPEAWLDEAIDLEQFGTMQSLRIYFNTPMSPASSPHPILSWPNLAGVASWDNTQTILTFKPSSLLDRQKTYTFFLDPALPTSAGKALTNFHEWNLHIQSGPKVQRVSPQPGSLETRYKTIEIDFDQQMNTSISEDMLSIAPKVAFALKWKSERSLQIILQQPLESDQRYDLTLTGGSAKNSLFAADGSYLAEDYRWFYWQKPFDVKTELLGATTLAVKFNYALDPQKSGQPFSISPVLDGEWKWSSTREIRFTAKASIPASKEFTLNLVSPLVDANGFETSTIPIITFSGMPPLRLVAPNLVKSEYSDDFFADRDVQEIRLEINSPVDHASAEKDFSLTPSVPGKFRWEKVSDGSKETLIYALNKLLKPGTKYSLKINATLLDARGKPLMLHPYEQSFVTNEWGGYLSPSFGEAGNNIQIVDANGARRLQFGGGDNETGFSAYRFDLIDFAKLY